MNYLYFKLKKLEREEQVKCKISRKNKMIRAKINEVNASGILKQYKQYVKQFEFLIKLDIYLPWDLANEFLCIVNSAMMLVLKMQHVLMLLIF